VTVSRRTPFVLIDELVRMDARSAHARTRFPADADIFVDHFPGRPVVPGVLLTEAMAQTSGWLIAAGMSFTHWPLLALIRDAKFRRPVPPDTEIDIEATIQLSGDEIVETAGRAAVNGSRVASASLVFRLQNVVEARDPRLERWVHDTFARLNGPVALGR
jgi:3-hydroxyacyl-[acyl-carrier-protein] dehydratase